MRNEENVYVSGASNLIDTLDLSEESSVVLLTTEPVLSESAVILQAFNERGFFNLSYIVIPEIFRPMDRIPKPLSTAVSAADAVIYTVNRLSEENFAFNRPLQQICIQSNTKYLYLYDPKLDYFSQGIAADNRMVRDKALRIQALLQKSVSIRVTSKLGTDLSFSLHTHNIMPRSPIFNPGVYWNQAPEGEVMSCPRETTFNGTMVIDGVATGMGEPPVPVMWRFEDGQITDVDGDDGYLSELLGKIKKSDSRVESFLGMWIAELSIGCNDWAVFDGNISNCEKVSGGIHFAMGNSEGLGVDRGEKYHFDNIMKKPTITVFLEKGEEIKLIEDGKLLI